MTSQIIELITVLACTFFTGAAVYITAVEHPARLSCGAEIALALSGRWPRSCVNPGALEKSGLRRWQPVSMERGPNS